MRRCLCTIDGSNRSADLHEIRWPKILHMYYELIQLWINNIVIQWIDKYIISHHQTELYCNILNKIRTCTHLYQVFLSWIFLCYTCCKSVVQFTSSTELKILWSWKWHTFVKKFISLGASQSGKIRTVLLQTRTNGLDFF